MRILISGGNSRFAKELIKQNSVHELFAVSKKELNILNFDSICLAIENYKPDIFIHPAGLSRPMAVHDLDPSRSIQLNIIGTSQCVMACIKYNIKFVYISTDYVYPGKLGNYRESDGVYPVNKYAWSKLGGECSAMMYKNSLILRMAMLEYPFPHEKAFDDLYKSSIWHSDAAAIVYKLIEKNSIGIYNIGNERKSVYDFVSQKNLNILRESKCNIQEYVPDDISMNIEKLNNTLNDTII